LTIQFLVFSFVQKLIQKSANSWKLDVLKCINIMASEILSETSKLVSTTVKLFVR